MGLKAVGAKLVDAGTHGRLQMPGLAFLRIPENDDSIAVLVRTLFQKWRACLPPDATTDCWKVFAGREAYSDDNPPLRLSDRVGSMGASDDDLLFIEVPTDHIVSLLLKGEQVKHLLESLEWKEPERLCRSTGRNWPYQGASEIAKKLKRSLVNNYKAWKENNHDGHCRALNVILSGAGTGKSRMLDKMKSLLCGAAKLSKDEDLMARMESAYVFRITFADGPEQDSQLIDDIYGDLDISYRMIYQLYKHKREVAWPLFVSKLKGVYSKTVFFIEEVLVLLAKLEHIDKLQDMTVLLCVDALDRLHHDGIKQSSKYLRVMNAIISFLNASKAFVVCACASRLASPFHEVQMVFRQRCTYLVPPTLDGDEILSPRTRIEQILVEDMGGHGRALEALDAALRSFRDEGTATPSPMDIIKRVCERLQVEYADLFRSPLLTSRTICQEVVAAILYRQQLIFSESIGEKGMTVDELLGVGFFRLSRETHGHLSCAFILLELLMSKLGKTGDMMEYLTRSVLGWQDFTHFVASYRAKKSTVFNAGPISLAAFHAGARFGPIDGICVKEARPRKVEEAKYRLVTKSDRSEVNKTFSNRDGMKCKTDTETIVINRPGAPAGGDIFMQTQLTEGEQETHRYEVIQCRLANQDISEVVFHEERAKAAGAWDIFLLITSAKWASEFALPSRCGIVSHDEFCEYFGPYATRAYRSLDPVNINTASRQDLSLVEGLDSAAVETIVAKRPFSSIDQAVSVVTMGKKSKVTAVLRSLCCD